MLRIDAVSIENLKGIERAEFPLGSLTVIKGSNGTGKSSILDAIATVFEGGHDPTLIRSGADKAHVKLTLSDGTTVAKTITAKGSTLNITTADGLKVPKPAAFVERLASGFSFDPISFLSADAKKRTQFLLEAMPIEFAPAEVAAITGKTLARALDLDGLAQLRAGIYENRRDLNVEAKELEGSIAGFVKSMPLMGSEDWPAKADALAARKTEITSEMAALKANIQSAYKDALAAETAKRSAAVAAAKAVYDAAVAEAGSQFEQAVCELGRIAADAENEELSALNAELQTVSADYATADERRRQQDQSIAMRRQIDTLDEKRLSKVSAADKLTMQLKALDDLRKDKLSAAAIPGIEIVNGEILVDGIPLDNLNTQARYFVAFQIAALKGGELGFMVVDNLEAIVGDEWEQFQAAAAESGYQVLGARAVEHTPLSLESNGETVPVKGKR
jgi:chromosome segregation ATPase